MFLELSESVKRYGNILEMVESEMYFGGERALCEVEPQLCPLTVAMTPTHIE
jgi:hypothetical protein